VKANGDSVMRITFVEFSPEHADQLVAMWRASFDAAVGVSDPHTVEEQRAYLLATVVPNNRVRVAVAEDRVVGFVAASARRIDQLYVHSDYQGRGIGSQLLQWAKDGSSGRLSLHTFERNLAARRFYERRGFEAVGRGFEPSWQLADIEYEWRDADRAEAAVSIRPGGLDDPRVQALLAQHLHAARSQTSPGSDHALDLAGLRSHDVRFWHVLDGDRVIGLGALKRLSEFHGEIKSMHTTESSRRKGAGSAMLRHIIAAAREMGMSRLSLETGSWPYFDAARAFYLAHGFRECPPFADYVPDPNSVFMTRPI
jgi:putative acetyltransferase